MFTACESIALLDMLASFADVATKRDYVRPELGSTLALQGARRPIVELVCEPITDIIDIRCVSY